MRVPVVILSGFLGSGKTTLLLKLLCEAKKRELSYAVLINERGKIDIDGILVSNNFNDGEIDTLLDGCICCSKKSEVGQSIDTLLQKKPDLIFIELTGIANPEEVADALNEREIIAKVVLQNIITVIDAEYFLGAHSRDFQDTLLQQVECADHIVINKMDLVQSTKQEIKRKISNHNTAAHLEFGIYGEIDFNSMFENILSLNNKKQVNSKSKTKDSSYSDITTIAVPIDRPLNKEDVENFISNHADKIIRAKGFVPIMEKSEEKTYLLQYSGIKKIEWKIESSEQFALILIGVDLDETTLKKEWLNLMEV